MSNDASTLYEALQEGTELGPEHHRFKLIKHNAQHELGQLWQAEDIGVAGNPLVSLLIINPAMLQQSAFAEGIKKHAALSKQLQNKHIAECYGFFSHKGGLLFLSYEKLDGLTLASMVKRGSQLNESQRLGLIKQVAYAVDMGFQKLRAPHGVLHPETIFINRRGGVKVTLFALREIFTQLTELSAKPLKHVQYQAPEAFHPGKLSRKADVYAFAAMLYELLTGKAPFSDKEGEAERVRKQLEKPAEFDDEQWENFQKAFATDIEERYPNCSELVKAVFTAKPEEEEKPAAAEEPAEEASDAEQADSKAKAEKGTATATEESAEGIDGEEEKPGLKAKLAGMLNLPRPVKLGLLSGAIFAVGFTLGWFISDFLNFKTQDFQKMQIAKQQEALNQMYSSLEAQQELAKKQKDEIEELQLNNTVLKQQLQIAKGKVKSNDPEKPGNQIFKDQIDTHIYGPEMVLLPSGEFRMGDQADIGDDNEKPVHIVHIDKPFAISRFEVTFAQYDAFADATDREQPDDNGWGRGNQPVINVSWRDALAYVNWLKKETGQPYRLPSEAEWEYAARAGTLTPYWWGEEMQPNMAVCASCGSQWDGKQPAPVGSFKANPWGLHDMTGNVDEWVADCYEDDYKRAPIDGSAYTTRPCVDKVMRGGSWFDIERLIRPASRYRHPIDARRNTWGFRVALDIEE